VTVLPLARLTLPFLALVALFAFDVNPAPAEIPFQIADVGFVLRFNRRPPAASAHRSVVAGVLLRPILHAVGELLAASAALG
jgi:hypothetical protein